MIVYLQLLETKQKNYDIVKKKMCAKKAKEVNLIFVTFRKQKFGKTKWSNFCMS